MKVFAYIMAVVSALLLAYAVASVVGSGYGTGGHRVACFDVAGKYKFSAKEDRFWFDGAIIRGEGANGEYAIYPLAGSICSIVVEDAAE
jgi:hypothetical protein